MSPASVNTASGFPASGVSVKTSQTVYAQALIDIIVSYPGAASARRPNADEAVHPHGRCPARRRVIPVVLQTSTGGRSDAQDDRALRSVRRQPTEARGLLQKSLRLEVREDARRHGVLADQDRADRQ